MATKLEIGIAMYIFHSMFIIKYLHTCGTSREDSAYICVCVGVRSSKINIGFNRVNQEKMLIEFVGYITLAGNQQ